jgi:hypothetical protein
MRENLHQRVFLFRETICPIQGTFSRQGAKYAKRQKEKEALPGADTQRKQGTFCGKFLTESDNAIEAVE